MVGGALIADCVFMSYEKREKEEKGERSEERRSRAVMMRTIYGDAMYVECGGTNA